MRDSARLQAAIEILAEIEATRLPADAVIEAYFRSRRYAGSKDRRAVADRVYGLLRRRARLDWGLAELGLEASPRTRALLAAFQDGEDPAGLLGGPHGPAPLEGDEERLFQPLPSGMPEAVALECPAWLEPALRDVCGADFPAALAALNRPAPVDLRVNSLKATREAALAALTEEGVEAAPTPLSPLGLRLAQPRRLGGVKAFVDGLVEVQDEGSQLLALLTGAKPGMTVVDFCAGGGGKALALAAAMGNQGRLWACDADGRRLARLEDRRRRAGVRIVASHLLGEGDDPWLAANAATADRVLLDVPCSGSGTWRRAPEARWRLDAAMLEDLREKQRSILDAACSLAKPGGWLVYATCSLLREENEAPVEAFLAAHPEFTALPAATVWREALGDIPCPAPAGPFLRLAPHATGTDGFFLAVVGRPRKMA